MKKFSIQAILLLIVIIAAVFIYKYSLSGNVIQPFTPPKPKLSNLQVNNSIIKAEVADTAQKRNKGLGGRQSLASDEGMLFVFDKPDIYSFWMKGLNFPLDFVWIRADTVADFQENALPPSPGQPDQSLLIYKPKEPVDKVLEVNGGIIQKLNIKVGDKIVVTQ